jgi:hypothetical protein
VRILGNGIRIVVGRLIDLRVRCGELAEKGV